MKKYLLPILIFIILVAIYLTYKPSQPKLLSLPTKEHPAPSGLYTEIPPFDEWQWKEGKNEKGSIVYRIKIPPDDKFISGLKPLSEFWNQVHIYIYKRTNDSSKNISEYYENHEDEFLSHLISQIGNFSLYKYNSHLSIDRGGVYKENLYYILTEHNLLLDRKDYDPECLLSTYKSSNDFRGFTYQAY